MKGARVFLFHKLLIDKLAQEISGLSELLKALLRKAFAEKLD